jgi:hypothetical protein
MMYFVVLALALGIAFRWPRQCWFVGSIGYLVSGPLMKLWSIAFPTRKVELPPAETPAPVA